MQKQLGAMRRIRSTKRKPVAAALKKADVALGHDYLVQPNRPVTRAELAMVTQRTLKAIDREIARRTLLGVCARVIAWLQVAVLGYIGPRKGFSGV